MLSHWALGCEVVTGSSEDLNVRDRKEDVSVGELRKRGRGAPAIAGDGLVWPGGREGKPARSPHAAQSAAFRALSLRETRCSWPHPDSKVPQWLLV